MVARHDVGDGIHSVDAVAELEDEGVAVDVSCDEDVGVVPGTGAMAEGLTIGSGEDTAVAPGSLRHAGHPALEECAVGGVHR